MKKQLTLLLTMLLFYNASGQQKLKPLDIGDQIPNLKFENVLNHPDGEIFISDYKDKLLILDFWATWCAPCVASFPKLDSLDKAFGDDLTILPVTYQNKEEVEKLFSRMPKLKDIKKPMIYGDEILRRMFPHKVLPHYVWVNTDGEVLAITELNQLTSENIHKVLSNQKVLFTNREIVHTPFNYDSPVFINNPLELSKNIKLQYSLAPYLKGVSSQRSIKHDSASRTLTITAINSPLINIYKHAFWDDQNGRFFGKNRIVIEEKIKEKFTSEKTGTDYLNWLADGNGFIVEMIIPEDLLIKRDQTISSILAHMFPAYKAEIKTELRNVYSLIKLNSDVAIKASEQTESYFKGDFTSFSMVNKPIELLLNNLNLKYLQFSDLPVVNKSDLDFSIDLHLEGNLFDIQVLKKQLNRYNLDLIEEQAEIEILSIISNPEY